MPITNAERIAIMVAESPKTVKIYTVPQSQYWIVMYVSKASHPNWRCVICNPELTTWRLVTEHITPEEHWELYKRLVNAQISSKFKYYLEELKKTTNNFKQNKSYEFNKLQGPSCISKESSKRRIASRKSTKLTRIHCERQ
jgi:hypothetical protein